MAASAEIDGPRVQVFGRAGTFGGLAGARTTPSGDALATAAIRGWGFASGQAAYFPVVAPDGTVIIAGEPQTDDQLRPTSRQMVVSTFHPGTGRFANVVIPTSTGKTTLAGPWAAPGTVVGGGDISDIGVVRVGGEPRVMFTSAMPFWGWSAGRGGEFPTLGALQPLAQGIWAPDLRRSRTATQLASSAAQSRSARTREACVLRRYPTTGAFGDCRMPAEFAQLPASGALAVTQYAFDDPARGSGRVSILDPRGGVLASLPYPTIKGAGGERLAVHPREVVADPRGTVGDERFVVIFDAELGAGRAGDPSVPGAAQEFRYDAAARTITPTSLPLLTGDQLAGQPLGFETALYASDGSLWLGQSLVGTLQAGPVAVYRRAPGAASPLALRPGCAAPAGWSGGSWGRACAPDQRVGEAAPLGIARSLDEDPATGTILLTTMSGFVLPMRALSDGVRAGRPIDLGLDRLADRSALRIGPRKAAFDGGRRSLWIPIQQLQTDRLCAAWPCPPRVLDQWLVEVDVRGLAAH